MKRHLLLNTTNISLLLNCVQKFNAHPAVFSGITFWELIWMFFGENDRKSNPLRILLISSTIFIFSKVTVDLVTSMNKTDATFHVAEILFYEVLLRVSL